MDLLPKKQITPERFCQIQLKLGWTNQQAATYFCKVAQTITNWRCGEQKVPLYVVSMLNTLIKDHGSIEKAGTKLRDTLQEEWEALEEEKLSKK